MHLLATEPGMIADGSAAVDLGQNPGDIIMLAAPTPRSRCSPQRRPAACR
jgi:cobaltochelatase CobN